MTKAIALRDRGVVEASGDDSGRFLHRLVTNDVASLRPGEARFAALLTPQGKILFDFLVFAVGAGRYFLDCPRSLAQDLARRLDLYRLRSKVTVLDRSDEIEAIFFPDAAEALPAETLALARDPRASIGFRALAERGKIPAGADRERYDALRVRAGVPEGGVDFAYGDAFPHEANMDLLNGIDFAKGCYVGQEVVSRMKHRGLVRKRVTPYRARGVAPAPGETIRAGEFDIGVTGSRAGSDGLALVRLDRLEDARAKGLTPEAAGTALYFREIGANPARTG